MTTSCRRPSPERVDVGNTHGETGSTFPSPTLCLNASCPPGHAWPNRVDYGQTVTGEAAGLLCYYHPLP